MERHMHKEQANSEFGRSISGIVLLSYPRE
jgi:hypothetical protein